MPTAGERRMLVESNTSIALALVRSLLPATFFKAAISISTVLHSRVVPDFVPDFVSHPLLPKKETLHVPQSFSVTSLRISASEKSGLAV